MPRLRLALPLAVSAALALAGPAAATPITASSDDPQGDSSLGPSTDIQQARTSFDADAGTWSLTVRFWAPVTESPYAMINAYVETTCGDGATSFASVRASTRPSDGGVYGNAGAASDPPQADGSQGSSPYTSATRTLSDDRQEITLQVASPRLNGRTAGCLELTMSHNGVVDRLDAPARFPGAVTAAPLPGEPGGGSANPTPSPAPSSGGQATPPASTPVVVALKPGTRTLSARRLHVALKPFSVALTGTARLTAHRAPVLAKATWKAAARRAVVIKLKLTKAGRRWIHRHRRATVRLTIGARPPAAAVVTKSFSLKLRP